MCLSLWSCFHTRIPYPISNPNIDLDLWSSSGTQACPRPPLRACIECERTLRMRRGSKSEARNHKAVACLWAVGSGPMWCWL